MYLKFFLYFRPKIGRVITTERGKGYGKQIMLHAIDAAIKHFYATRIDIEAQEYAKSFYESVGFKQSSDTFMLDGIPHIRMTLMIEKWEKDNNLKKRKLAWRHQSIDCKEGDFLLIYHKRILHIVCGMEDLS